MGSSGCSPSQAARATLANAPVLVIAPGFAEVSAWAEKDATARGVLVADIAALPCRMVCLNDGGRVVMSCEPDES